MAVTILVRNHVADYDAWKKVFDDAGPTRRAHGVVRSTVYRDASDPGLVVVLSVMSDIQAARRWMSSPQLVDGMARGGVTKAPEIEFLTEVDQQTY